MTALQRLERPDEGVVPVTAVRVDSADASSAKEQESAGLLRSVHGLLRGRYLWLLLLAAILGGSAACYSYKNWKPMYRSRGQVRIAPIVPRVLYSVEDNGMMPAYEGFIDSQMALMRSSRVVDLAMQSEDWKKFGRTLSDAEVERFKASLKVGRSKGSQVVDLTFSDGDPEVARAAIRSVVPAYMEIYGEEDLKREEARLNVLEQRRVALTNELKSLQDRIHAIANEFGSDSLEQAFEYKLQEVHRIESRLRDLDLKKGELELALKRLQAGEPEAEAVDEWKPLDAFDIARRDPLMRDYVEQLQQVELQRSLAASFRKEAHPDLRGFDRRIEDIKARIRDYALEFNVAALNTAVEGDGNQSKLAVTREIELIKSTMEKVQTTLTETENDTREFGRKDLQIKRLREEAVVVKQRLKETNTRLEMLNVERSLSVSGRVSIISRGDRPTTPENLKDRTSNAAMSAAGGSGVAAALVLLWGYLSRRHRYVEDASHLLERAPLLGIIPQLSVDGEDSEQFDVAGTAINQMRALLQVGPVSRGLKAFAVTSGSAGEGKTSLVAAIGTSFANSGKRTLVVDLDLIGRSLSRRWPVQPAIDLETALCRVGGVDEEELQRAKAVAADSEMAFDQACLELGLIDAEGLDRARDMVSQSCHGLEHALGDGDLSDCVRSTEVDRLDALSISDELRRQPNSLSPEPIRQLIDRAKSEYDIVLVDTGPVPGSLEASLVVSQVDEVILVVSQGSDQKSATHAMSHLTRLNVSVGGVVYNRATRRCTERYVSSQYSVSRRTSRPATDKPNDRSEPCPLLVASSGTTHIPAGNPRQKSAT